MPTSQMIFVSTLLFSKQLSISVVRASSVPLLKIMTSDFCQQLFLEDDILVLFYKPQTSVFVLTDAKIKRLQKWPWLPQKLPGCLEKGIAPNVLIEFEQQFQIYRVFNSKDH